jgi:hypothetical protein
MPGMGSSHGRYERYRVDRRDVEPGGGCTKMN